MQHTGFLRFDLLLLAVKKLGKRASSQQKDDDFIEIMNNIDRIRHANVVGLMGYCKDKVKDFLYMNIAYALLTDDEFKRNFHRIPASNRHLELQEPWCKYLHEVCEPPVVHMSFKSTNHDLSVRVSDCRSAPLIS
ncbi:Protein kinase-like domain containing protein [Parasponia andersonii]|uniref:non-specific serine/threonine protein kinase n=1 Tax=Parasponia andersonii TaxID=3476 RepID=A0A2P5E4V0_PARAD|nr:Protein kinase-like domain containing protein [Parasponia andersonii]